MPEANDEARLAQLLFGHEQDLLGNLRRFPLIVRYRLDLLQLSMPLDAWQSLSYPERRAIALAPTGEPAERAALLNAIQAIAVTRLGHPLQHAVPKAMADFRLLSEVPEQVVHALECFGLSITTRQWAALDELSRFGLVKLSREGHENRRLGPLVDDLFHGAGGNAALAPIRASGTTPGKST